MRTVRAMCVAVVVFLCATFLMRHTVSARQLSSPQQSNFPSQTTPGNSHVLDPTKDDPKDPARARFEEEAAKSRNNDRFKRIQSDTEKLLKLSTELKEDVDKSTKNEMSLDVIRKAAEVEKLAHDVKERMKS